MEGKRFTFNQNGNYHIVVDNIEYKPLIVMEFKENEFWKYACFHRIIDLLNEFYEENERLHDEIFKLRTEIAYDRTVNDKNGWFKEDDEHLAWKRGLE